MNENAAGRRASDMSNKGFLKRLDRASKRETGMNLSKEDVFMLSGFFGTAIAELNDDICPWCKEKKAETTNGLCRPCNARS